MTPQLRAAILAVLLLAGCVRVNRTIVVNVRADDHFDIAPVVGKVDLDAAFTFPTCALSDYAPPAAIPPHAAHHGATPAPAGLSVPTSGEFPW